MKIRSLLSIPLALLCVFLVWRIVLHARELDVLRDEQTTLQTQSTAPAEQAAATPVQNQEAQPDNPTSSGTSELLRLRGEVRRLTRTKQELSAVVAENQRLKNQLESASTNAAATLASGFIRTATARNAGYATPEAALETMLWAVRQRDSNALLQCFQPEFAATLEENRKRSAQSFDNLFNQIGQVPGLRTLKKETIAPGMIKIQLDVTGTGDWPTTMVARQIGAEWKLAFGD